MDNLANNFLEIKNIIDKRKTAINQEVHLIAVSKTFANNDIIQLYNLGQREFAENYALEFYNKTQELQYLDIQWHYIGNLQTNKIKYIAPYAYMVQSVEKASQIIHLSKHRPYNLPKLKILLQINVNGTSQQHGIKITDIQNIIELAELIDNQENLIFHGIMGIASNSTNKKLQNEEFSQLYELFVMLKSKFSNVDTLSMGMSNDFETAIACGTTHIRIGSKLFGTRNYTQ
ncbi:MAG: YggS family pyridoxal phosphate-dependent enzyme [Proteobacteria bacterium]|jgi:pyridoxal phosphate enzyme (YggS family)|nr:YggS family pyridoxal phosphate-dependent enzyme [Pseudomonadota bacterium]